MLQPQHYYQWKGKTVRAIDPALFGIKGYSVWAEVFPDGTIDQQNTHTGKRITGFIPYTEEQSAMLWLTQCICSDMQKECLLTDVLCDEPDFKMFKARMGHHGTLGVSLIVGRALSSNGFVRCTSNGSVLILRNGDFTATYNHQKQILTIQ